MTEFDDQKKYFFVGEDDHTDSYVNQDGVTCYNFLDDNRRHYCLTNFLAYHSKEINTKNDSKQVLTLTFNGDEEIYEAMIEPKNFSEKIVWTDVTDETRDLVDKQPKNSISVSLTVNCSDQAYTSDQISEHDGVIKPIYKMDFYTDPVRLYSEVPLPWMIENKYKQPMLVHLSMFQKEFYNEYQKHFDFYPTPEALEPVIDQELKRKICGQIVAKIIEIAKDQDWSKKVIQITFKNGDRSILSAMTGTIDYRFYEIVDRETLQDQPYYKQIENAETSVVITGYVPRTEDVMYTLINTDLQIDNI